MIRYVMSEDISNILSMMEQVKEAFPGYQEIEFLEALYKAIDCKTAFLEEREGRLAGMLTFSYQEKELTFLAVVPEFRKQGVGKRLIKQMVECFEEGETVHYHSCGFVDDEELVVFDYPCQKMVLKVGG